MARNYKELRAKMSPESIERSEQKTWRLAKGVPLDELRAARDLTQEHLARILGVNQASISKVERRTDMYISTLRDFIRAMGGELEIRAKFPEGEVVVDQFGKDQALLASNRCDDSNEDTARLKKLEP